MYRLWNSLSRLSCVTLATTQLWTFFRHFSLRLLEHTAAHSAHCGLWQLCAVQIHIFTYLLTYLLLTYSRWWPAAISLVIL